MDNSILEKLKPHWFAIALGMAGVMFLVYGLTTLSTPKDTKGEITFEAASDSRSQAAVSAETREEEKTITVDIEGAVEKPGVYDLPAEARVQDALIAAGGMSKDADREKVSKGLNLAAKLTDGGKIYIPLVGESTLVSSGQVVLGSEASSAGTININTASASELDKLSGVGQVTAEKIMSNRPYTAIEELVSKKVVSQKVFEQIKGNITVY